MRWHGNRTIKVFKGTIYYARAGQGRYIVIYYHRRSKVSGVPTIHIELRLTNPDQCRRNHLGDLHQVLKSDTPSIFKKNVKFAFVDRNTFNRKLDAAAGRQVRKFNGRRSPYANCRNGWRRRIRYMLGRELVGDAYEVKRDLFQQVWVQNCIDAKLPIFFGHTTESLPVNILSGRVKQAWPRPLPYNNKCENMPKWKIED
jgi:hypothetical protein